MSLAPVFRRRLDPEERYGLRVTLLAAALVLVTVPFGWLLNQVEGNGSLVRLDTSAAKSLHGWAQESPGPIGVLKALSVLGSPVWLFAIAGVAAAVLWRLGRPRSVLFLAVTAVSGGLLNTAVKIAVNRPRPSLVDPVATADGRSFPSGHATSSTIVYGALVLVLLPLLARRWRPAAAAAVAVLVVAIGFSRLALGVHYLSDVLGGHVLGMAWLLASVAAFRLWRSERAVRTGGAGGVEPQVAQERG